MSFNSRSFRPAIHPRPKAPPTLAVGSRALVIATAGTTAVLTQRDGQTPVGSIAHGTEVTIDAWLSAKEGGPRYLVVAATGGPQGWLSPLLLAPVPRTAVRRPEALAAPAGPTAGTSPPTAAVQRAPVEELAPGRPSSNGG